MEKYIKPNTVKRLEEVIFDEKKQRLKNTAPELITKPNYRDDTATGLTRCIIDFLQFKGHQAERINSTGIPYYNEKGDIKWRKGTSTNGTSDISATIKDKNGGGRSVKIEVKIGADRQSPAQKEYQQSVEAAGGIYFIAHNFTEFAHWYRNTFE